MAKNRDSNGRQRGGFRPPRPTNKRAAAAKEEAPESTTPEPETPAHVAIFGAGVAGLTAAHELIERGYRVDVYEPAKPGLEEEVCAIGGMARTHWGRVDKRRPGESRKPLQHVQSWSRLPCTTIAFEKEDSAELSPEAVRRLRVVADALLERKIGLFEKSDGLWEVRIEGYSSKAPPTKARTGWDEKRAQAVKDYLEVCGVAPERLQPIGMGVGHPDDPTCPNDERRFVELKIIEDIIPGEHGFRFFPGFYRHLFDTMRRTPIAGASEPYVESGRTVFDNVVSTTTQGVAFEGARPLVVSRQPFDSALDVLRDAGRLFATLGCTFEDASRLQLKLFKYLTSSSARRADEYERLSWWDFLEGERFSEKFGTYLKRVPQMLVAMRSEDSDARTIGNIAVQLLMDKLAPQQRTDGTLNGPTSLAWFQHWRRYLERQGVVFHRGRLVELRQIGETVFPVVEIYGERLYDDRGTHRRVSDGVEVDPKNVGVVQGERIEAYSPQQARKYYGQKIEKHTMALDLDYYVVAIPPHEIQTVLGELKKKAPKRKFEPDCRAILKLKLGGREKRNPKSSIAHLSGIQFYFDGEVQFVPGHTIYPDSKWELSSISQPQFWTRKRGEWDGYRGILSVDIANWTATRSKEREGKRYCAWEATPDELANEVWQQIVDTVWIKSEVPHEPLYYHLDRFMERDRTTKKITHNQSCLLINRPEEYAKRPGTPGRYDLCLGGRFVFAGTQMQTYTRLTTMEAANESARTAVNAILDRDGYRGDRCRVENPENHEPRELCYLVELDEQLWRRGQPHFLDTLGLETLPKALLNEALSSGIIQSALRVTPAK